MMTNFGEMTLNEFCSILSSEKPTPGGGSASGVALENGQKGEKIRVMNLSSEKNLVAWVINEKKVSIKAKINSN